MRRHPIILWLLVVSWAAAAASAQTLSQDPARPSPADMAATLAQMNSASGIFPIPATALAPMGVPGGPNAWVLRIVSGGGFTGQYRETVVTSQRNVRCSRETQCRGRLSRQQLQSLSRLLSDSTLLKWQQAPAAPAVPSVCSDCTRVWMELRHREQDGTERVYSTTWDPVSASSLPTEVKEIYESAVAFRR